MGIDVFDTTTRLSSASQLCDASFVRDKREYRKRGAAGAIKIESFVNVLNDKQFLRDLPASNFNVIDDDEDELTAAAFAEVGGNSLVANNDSSILTNDLKRKISKIHQKSNINVYVSTTLGVSLKKTKKTNNVIEFINKWYRNALNLCIDMSMISAPTTFAVVSAGNSDGLKQRLIFDFRKVFIRMISPFVDCASTRRCWCSSIYFVSTIKNYNFKKQKKG